MRLIDADELRQVLAVWTGYALSATEVAAVIEHAPTIDADPVVRCKDCRFYLQSNEKCELVDTRLRFYETDKTWTEDCFCVWGERKDNVPDTNVGKTMEEEE